MPSPLHIQLSYVHTYAHKAPLSRKVEPVATVNFKLFRQLSLSSIILIFMALGLVAGFYSNQPFYGTQIIAEAFVTLLQMAALPYISLSLISGIGGLQPAQGITLLRKGLLILFPLLALTLLFVLSAPAAFPDWPNASFYSANTVKPVEHINLVGLFIPANPFNAYANTLIPSVVLFSILVGVGLISVKNNQSTLTFLAHMQEAIANINTLTMKMAPLAVFCIAQSALATIQTDQIAGLFVYITTAATITLLLAFITLPGIVAILTPFSFREVILVCREPLITAFATGNFFAVIPLVVEKLKKLLLRRNCTAQSADQLPSIIVPICFSLPVGGKLFALVFIIFSAWFSGERMGLIEYQDLITLGLPQLFGSIFLAMPVLLDVFNINASMFDLFLVSENLIVSRLGALLSVMFSVSLSLLIASAISGQIQMVWRRLFRFLFLVPPISLGLLFAISALFSEISHQYQGYDKFIDRDFLRYNAKSSHRDQPAENSSMPAAHTNTLTRIHQRGQLRVGFFRDDLPYAFHNKQGKLVGFDIEIMNMLAEDLGVSVEFVRIYRKDIAPLLKSGYLDITTGVPLIPDNMKEYNLTIPYSEETLAFLVKGGRRSQFYNWESISQEKDLLIGIPETFFYRDGIRRRLNKPTIWELSSPRLLFNEKYQDIDGMMFGAAAASAWSLLYPSYSVVVPKPVLPPLMLAFPISRHDYDFGHFMSNWIITKKQNHAIEALFEYWIKGQSQPL